MSRVNVEISLQNTGAGIRVSRGTSRENEGLTKITHLVVDQDTEDEIVVDAGPHAKEVLIANLHVPGAAETDVLHIGFETDVYTQILYPGEAVLLRPNESVESIFIKAGTDHDVPVMVAAQEG